MLVLFRMLDVAGRRVCPLACAWLLLASAVSDASASCGHYVLVDGERSNRLLAATATTLPSPGTPHRSVPTCGGQPCPESQPVASFPTLKRDHVPILGEAGALLMQQHAHHAGDDCRHPQRGYPLLIRRPPRL